MADADVVKRVSIIFEAHGAKDANKAGKDLEDGLKRVGKAADDAVGDAAGKRGGIAGLWKSIGGLGGAVAKVGSLFGQFGLAVAGAKVACDLLKRAGVDVQFQLELVGKSLYEVNKAAGRTGNAFSRMSDEIRASMGAAVAAAAPLFALADEARGRRAKAPITAGLAAGGAAGSILSAAAGYSPFRTAAPKAAKSGGGGGGAPVDPYAAIAGLDFGRQFGKFGDELKASGDAGINKSFAGGSDQTLAAKGAEIESALAGVETAFATATTAAAGFAEVQAAITNADQVETWSSIVGDALEKVGRGLATAAVNALFYGQNFAQAAKMAIKATAAQATVEALFQSGKGFALLAIGRPDLAASAFTSAKVNAAVAIAAGVATAGLGGFGGGGGGGRTASPVSSGVGDTARSTPGNQPTQVTVFVGISRREVTDAVVEETTARGTRRGVPRLAMAT